jgi:hypothetical protein
METHPLFRIPRLPEDLVSSENYTNPKRQMFYDTELHPALYYMDSICTLAFFVELILRLICSPSKCLFFKSAFNIIDIFCVVPMTIVLFVQWIKPDIWESSHFYLLISYLSLASVLRVFRLFKLARHYRGFKILHLAVKSSLKELFLLFILISTGMVIFSTLVYYAEFNQDNKFTSIPISFWWSIITMTTVGYGDIVPTSSWGYLVGSACAIAGTLITGLPIPIIASNFNYYYNYSRLLIKMAERKDSSSAWKGQKTINADTCHSSNRRSVSSSRNSRTAHPKASTSRRCSHRASTTLHKSSCRDLKHIPTIHISDTDDMVTVLPGTPLDLLTPTRSDLYSPCDRSTDSALTLSIVDSGMPSERSVKSAASRSVKSAASSRPSRKSKPVLPC